MKGYHKTKLKQLTKGSKAFRRCKVGVNQVGSQISYPAVE